MNTTENNEKGEHPFKAGQTVKIKNNLFEELVKIGMDEHAAASFHNRWAGMCVVVYATWSDEDQHWVTVDIMCEIPTQCCELI